MEPISIISTIKDIILTFAALTGAVVAWRGLSAWTWQLTCQTEYELARRLLRATYNYREAINIVRAPFMSSVEIPEPPEDSPLKSPEQKRWYGTARGYEKRWEHIFKAHSELKAELLDAEVLWGKEFCKDFSVLFALENELYCAIIDFVDSKDPRTEIYNPRSTDDAKNTRKIIFGFGNPDNDNFFQGLENAIMKVETTTKPYLRFNKYKKKRLFQR